MPLAPAARPATTQCPVFTSSYTVLPYTELPQRVSKTISHTSKKVQQANDLRIRDLRPNFRVFADFGLHLGGKAKTVASIKQQISRRDFHKVLATRIASTTAMVVCPALSWLNPKPAYAEEPAAAADKCPNLPELGKKFRPADFSVRKSFHSDASRSARDPV
eukprot:2333400-Rhodomonas_salina.4